MKHEIAHQASKKLTGTPPLTHNMYIAVSHVCSQKFIAFLSSNVTFILGFLIVVHILTCLLSSAIWSCSSPDGLLEAMRQGKRKLVLKIERTIADAQEAERKSCPRRDGSHCAQLWVKMHGVSHWKFVARAFGAVIILFFCSVILTQHSPSLVRFLRLPPLPFRTRFVRNVFCVQR